MPGRFEPDSGRGRAAKRFKVDLIRRAFLFTISFARPARRRRLRRPQPFARLASFRAHSMRSRQHAREELGRQEELALIALSTQLEKAGETVQLAQALE